MTAETALILLFGMLAGGALGYVTAWRHARKLEHHGVNLADWDQYFDMQAPRLHRAGTVHELSKAR